MIIFRQQFHECGVRETLLAQEMQFRSQAKANNERTAAAILANGALLTQRIRHRHELACVSCSLRLELQGAA